MNMSKNRRQSNNSKYSSLTRLNRKTRRKRKNGSKKLPIIQQLINKAFVDYSEALVAPPTIMSINEQPVATLGNFSLITGKAKARKTFYVSYAIGSLQASDPGSVIQVEHSLGDFEVLYFDTEQSKHKVIEVAQRICRLNNVNMPYNRLKVFALRPFSVYERLEIIQSVIYSNPQAKLVVIDGARDLVHSINNEEEASKISNLFLKWTAERNIHIITVLHQNKSENDTNARGHLGSELVNKAETTLSVKNQKGGTSLVTCSYSRDLEFPSFTFKVNEQGLPEIVNGNSTVFRASPEAICNYGDPQEVSEEKRQEILQNLSQGSEQYKYQDLVNSISEAVLNVTGEDIGQTASKRYKVYFEEKSQIIKHGKDRSPSSYYTINIDST